MLMGHDHAISTFMEAAHGDRLHHAWLLTGPRGGANALLKNLEEPPTGSLFLLVSHAPGRLLPTIRSRCRTLRFQTLGADVMAQLLQAELPNADSSEIAGLIRAGEGAPGRALSFAGLDITGLDVAIERLVTEGDAQNAERSALGRFLALKVNHARYEVFLERAPARIAVEAARREGRALEQALVIWEEARTLAASAVPLSLDVQSTTFRLAGLLADMARDPYLQRSR